MQGWNPLGSGESGAAQAAYCERQWWPATTAQQAKTAVQAALDNVEAIPTAVETVVAFAWQQTHETMYASACRAKNYTDMEDMNKSAETDHDVTPRNIWRTPLSLDDNLPAKMIDIKQFLEASKLLERPWPEQSLARRIARCPTMHPFTAIALGAIRHWDQDEAAVLHVYTDGSAAGTRGGWGIAIIAELHDGSFVYYGAMRGEVKVSVDHQYIGAQKITNNTAELSAIIWAIAWAIQLKERADICFHYDNFQVEAAAMEINAFKSNTTMTQIIAFLHEKLCSIRGYHSISFRHVKGHSGQPWNEMADWLASDKPADVPTLQIPFPQEVVQNALMMQWSMYVSQGHVGAPPCHGGKVVISQGDPPVFDPADAFSAKLTAKTTVEETQASHQQATVTIRVGTANVQSLGPKELTEKDGHLQESARMHVFRKALDECDLHMVGVQEGRIRKAEVRHTGSWFAIAAGADSMGCHGNELWVNKDKPLSIDGQLVYLAPRMFLVTMAKPTVLMVTLQVMAFSVDILVAHAPTARSRSAKLRAWWNDAINVVSSRRGTHRPIVICIDTNSRIGSRTSEYIGPLAADEEDSAGAMFHKLLESAQMWVPQTWPQHHEGHKHTTWESPLLGQHRIGFIALPKSWKMPPPESTKMWTFRSAQNATA